MFKYACPHCWQEMTSCKCRSYPYFLIQIDVNLLPIVKTLYFKGYFTTGSFEGHCETEYGELYLSFKECYNFNKSLPKGVMLSDNGRLSAIYEGDTIEEQEEYK